LTIDAGAVSLGGEERSAGDLECGCYVKGI